MIARKGSLSGIYLNAILGESASPEGRRFSLPARRVLRQLTPATGRMRATAKPADQLRTASRLDESEFQDLLDLLDRRSHLITPVGEEPGRGHDQTTPSPLCYNFPHDFLVSEVREWLEETDRSTTRGRAMLDLRAATQRWTSDRQTGHLAGPLDCLRFTVLTRPSSADEREFVKVSARQSLRRALAVAAIGLILCLGFQFALMAGPTVRRSSNG